MIKFEWDDAKADQNLMKHGVSFDEAKSVFFDDYARQFYDELHSDTEDRFLMLGVSNNFRVLMVCHCEHEAGLDSRIRIISARKATNIERDFYEGPLP